MKRSKQLKLGIIGMSDGNGHPYSWAAIFNGYDNKYMKQCPFPVIPEYLAKTRFPQESLNHLGEVTHIWTQDEKQSQHISKAAKIPNVVSEMKNMIGDVDAILLARDDAENHYEMSLPFIKSGLPIFIDKPLAYCVDSANEILRAKEYENQIFSCSSLRFADEFNIDNDKISKLGKIRFVEATISKSWQKYAIHIIEPVIKMFPQRGRLNSVKKSGNDKINVVTASWEKLICVFKVLGDIPTPISIKLHGSISNTELFLKDTYSAFKNSLENFINVIAGQEKNIPIKDTLEIIEIIEKGS